MRYSNHGFVFIALIACNGDVDNNINVLTPDLFVEGEVDFGEVVVLYSGEATMSIANEGRAPLVIDAITLTDNSDGVFTFVEDIGDTASLDPAAGFEIEANESYDLQLNFEPETYISYSRELVITSNDAAVERSKLIPLIRHIIKKPVTDILITPQSQD